jgi:hypothetical protein
MFAGIRLPFLFYRNPDSYLITIIYEYCLEDEVLADLGLTGKVNIRPLPIILIKMAFRLN